MDRDISNLQAIINDLMVVENDFIITGYFNHKNNTVNPLLCFCKAIGITQIINVPTRQSNILDLIFVKDYTKVTNTKVFEAFIADHLATECTYSYEKPHKTRKTVAMRCFSEKNTTNFIDTLNNTYLDTNDFDAFLHAFYNIYDNLKLLFQEQRSSPYLV